MNIEVGIYKDIPLHILQPFRFHAFSPYQGDKLDRLATSIKEHGMMQPPIVRLNPLDTFEIISGHNRVEAAKLAGLPIIPVIVRELSDDEAILLANEANIEQRSFASWLHVERAKSIHQYHEAIKRQGNRSDLVADTSGDISQKSNDYARAKTADAYGKSAHTIKLYLALYKLIDGLMVRLDRKEFGTTAAQQLSHVSVVGQNLIETVLTGNSDVCRITVTNAILVRDLLDSYQGNNPDEETGIMEKVKSILTISTESPVIQPAFVSIKMEADDYKRLFPEQQKEEVIEEIIKAVEHYRERKIISPITKPTGLAS